MPLENTAKAILEIATMFDNARELTLRLCDDSNFRNYALTAIAEAERKVVRAYYYEGDS